ncbi:TM0106 family RecB-like putative nuclease [Prosthecomicrobium sp. N25]|uniref:TM0106 family RecB-like putative nuclease n=1 Tax=Prosthecomicrobium sp. N25 TaxID=3129254 RepID=UPI0030787F1E
MRNDQGTIILSPSDLMRFQGCRHATALDLRLALGEPLVPADDGAEAALLQKKGHAHEAAYLARLAAAELVEIARTDDFATAAAETTAAMRRGVPVIYQGALGFGPWQGWSDFIERVEEPSDLGPWSYEVADTKLKRRADPKHAIQLAIYSKAVAAIQGRLPSRAHVVIGSGERITIDLADVRHSVDRLAERLVAFVAAPHATVPEPTPSCRLCRWREHCDSHYDTTDSLVRVAGITRQQRRRLETTEIATLTALASSAEPVPRMAPETLSKLRTQARLQLGRRAGGPPTLELKALEPGRGFARLPRPSPGDLFFDMEGDPLVEGGREYLFGVFHEEGGFHAWWAHDEPAEKAALGAVLGFFVERLAADPAAHIYHYAEYEVTALKRLTQRYGTGEAVLDHLLRSQRFVDLYRVVQQGLQASEAGYSLKDLETFYLPKRDGEVATAGDSIVAYETWLETGEQAILDGIERYNEVDCRSTKGLRDWLLSVRPTDMGWFEHAADPTVPEEFVDAERDALRRRLDAARAQLGDPLADLLLELGSFHRRADKPAWWAHFDRLGRDAEDLIEDLECLADLRAIGPSDGASRTYTYPHQETKMREKAKPIVRELGKAVTIAALDRRQRRVTLAGTRATGPLPDRLDLLPAKPLDNGVLRTAVARNAAALADGGGGLRAIRDFLDRRPPRLLGLRPGEAIARTGDVVEAAVAAVGALHQSYLPIQGPPGTGKTYVSAKAIVALVRSGRRVAVSSNAHKAIDNLLLAVAGEARATGRPVAIVKKVSDASEAPDDPMIVVTRDNNAPLLSEADVVGGTAFLFARPEMAGMFDHLVVDEAGQVSIASLLAMAGAAENIVIVGDQMQLPQPVQGIHPGGSGLSTLDYLMEGRCTIAADRGLFLPVSRRMHPAVCRLVGELVYEGRLSSDNGAARQRIDGAPGLPPFGVLFEEIDHAGNAQTSEEEADRIVALHAALLGSSFTDRDGRTRRLGVEDVLVVSPYNAQVNLLTERLPDGARVGTVDRFQGQEAPASLISMATSSAEEMPRDVGFLFSLERLNVALSRAQALAVVVASPRLLDVPCASLDEMRLVNALCAVRAYARKGWP